MKNLIEGMEKLAEGKHSNKEMEKFFKGLLGKMMKRLLGAVGSGNNAAILQNTGAIVKTLASAPVMAGERGLSDDMEKLGNRLLSAAKK